MATKRAVKETAEIIPLYGRDEMNLVEFPFGPVTSAGGKTFEVEHPVFDRALNCEVTRKTFDHRKRRLRTATTN